MDFFDDTKFLEPRCPYCSIKLKYGLNTRFDKERNSEICINCGKEI